MMNKTIGFIGAGNMASCLIGGMIDNGYDHQLIRASEPDSDQREKASALGIEVTSSNNQLAEWADILVLSVKPQMLQSVIQEISPAIQKTQPLLVSIAAGVRTDTIGDWLEADRAIVRVMPNTPALINQGMSALFANDQVDETRQAVCESIFSAVGETLWLENEDDMDAVTAISGSGPAYFFLFMESMMCAAQQQGLEELIARKLVLKTALGAATMAAGSPNSPAELRAQVTSPGGTTEQAINRFVEGGLEKLTMDAIDAATKRSIELSKILGNESS